MTPASAGQPTYLLDCWGGGDARAVFSMQEASVREFMAVFLLRWEDDTFAPGRCRFWGDRPTVGVRGSQAWLRWRLRAAEPYPQLRLSTTHGETRLQFSAADSEGYRPEESDPYRAFSRAPAGDTRILFRVTFSATNPDQTTFVVHEAANSRRF
jgi:hypothetical protein